MKTQIRTTPNKLHHVGRKMARVCVRVALDVLKTDLSSSILVRCASVRPPFMWSECVCILHIVIQFDCVPMNMYRIDPYNVRKYRPYSHHVHAQCQIGRISPVLYGYNENKYIAQLMAAHNAYERPFPFSHLWINWYFSLSLSITLDSALQS